MAPDRDTHAEWNAPPPDAGGGLGAHTRPDDLVQTGDVPDTAGATHQDPTPGPPAPGAKAGMWIAIGLGVVALMLLAAAFLGFYDG